MSDATQPPAPQPTGPPPPTAAGLPAGRQPAEGQPRRRLLGCAFVLSLLFNVVAVVLFALGCLALWFRYGFGGSEHALHEVHYAGSTSAADRIAIIHLDGVIMEGFLDYIHKEIDQAARDNNVKAVVLRVNSPGGSVTASDDLHRRLTELVHGSSLKGTNPKILVASFGSLAASGAYYAAMPAQALFAERSSLTGSIGVFASFPNVKKLADHHGVRLDVIKQGEIKDSGNPFEDMTPKEREVWQDLIDHAYQQFLQVVEDGRPALKGGALLARRNLTPVRAGPDWLPRAAGAAEPYSRYLADGGVWTADKALEFHLVDKIGHLDDAIQDAHDRAGLGSSYRVVRYARPRSLVENLLGLQPPVRPAPLGHGLPTVPLAPPRVLGHGLPTVPLPMTGGLLLRGGLRPSVRHGAPSGARAGSARPYFFLRRNSAWIAAPLAFKSRIKTSSLGRR
jgi:protease-4